MCLKKVKTSKQAEIHHFKATPPMLLQATTEAFESFSPKKSRKLDRRSFTGVGNSTRKKKKFLSKASSSPYRPTSNLAHWKRARTRKRARVRALRLSVIHKHVCPSRKNQATHQIFVQISTLLEEGGIFFLACLSNGICDRQ